MEQTIQRLIDRAEINDLKMRYARGVDRADWEYGTCRLPLRRP